MEINWTKEEFEIYVLLYAAHCNFIETEEEQDYIISKIIKDESVYNKMHTIKIMDNEAISMKKIQEYLQYNKYSYHEKENLLRHIKKVFFADGYVDVLEKKVFAQLTTLRNVFSNARSRNNERHCKTIPQTPFVFLSRV